MTIRMVPVTDLGVGDFVDLEHDKFAAPADRANIFPYEYAIVEGAERETADCLRVDFNYTSIGFPVDHKVPRRED